MDLETLKNQLPDYAKDIKLNLGSVLTVDPTFELTEKQIHLIALSSAYASKIPVVIAAFEKQFDLTPEEKNGAKAATTIMAMNNVYYRFTHSISDQEIPKLPARLRMNIIANSGIGKKDFELCSLAVSAINGCSACMDSHVKSCQQHGVKNEAIQHAVRIASIIQAVAQVAAIENF